MKRSTGTPVNLLPLLDVLLCTMGTLIVVLGVLNRLARTHSVAEQQEQIATAREQITLRIEEVTKARDRTNADLDLARRKLSGIEDHARQLADKLKSLTDAGKQLATEKADDQREALRRQLADLIAEHERLDKDLQAARLAKVQKKLMFSVVPFDGVYKTNRRPIYIECRSDVIIIQPEGIVLTPTDFSGPPGPGNPLAAALRAAQEYWREIPPPSAEVSNEPYPLLLVRPDGIIAYYLARDAMSSWNAEFGYELISADGKFEFPIQPEARLADMERRAVDESRKRLQWLAQVSPEAFDHKQKVQYRVSAIRGGLVRDGAPSLGNDPFANDPLGGFGCAPGNGSGAGDSEYGANGNGSPGGNPYADQHGGSALGNGGRGNGYGGIGGGGNEAFGTGSGSAKDGLAGNGGNGEQAFGNGGPGTNGMQSGGAPGSVYGNGALAGDGSGNGTFGIRGNDNRGNGSGGNSSGANGSSANGSGGFKNGGAGYLTGAAGGSAGGAGTENEQELSLLGPRYSGGGGDSQGGQAGGQFGANGQGGVGTGTQDGGPQLNAPGLAGGGASSGSSGSSAGTAFGNSSMAGNSSMQSGGSKSSASSASGGSSFGGGSADGDSSDGSGSSSGGSASASAGQMGQSGMSSGSETTQQTAGVPSPSFNYTANQQRSSRNLAKERGRNWAIQPTASSVPITRPIRVECWNDRLVIVPDVTDQQPQVIPMTDRTDEAVDQLVAAVRVHTQSWGLAGKSMYWKPQLTLDVKPNAESRAADLQTLMAGSGLDVKPIRR